MLSPSALQLGSGCFAHCGFSQGALFCHLHPAPLSRDSSLKHPPGPPQGLLCPPACEAWCVFSWILSFLDILLAASAMGRFCLASLEKDSIFTVFVCQGALDRSCAQLGLQSPLNAARNDGVTADCPLGSLRVALCPCHAPGGQGWLWAQGCAAGTRQCRCSHLLTLSL